MGKSTYTATADTKELTRLKTNNMVTVYVDFAYAGVVNLGSTPRQRCTRWLQIITNLRKVVLATGHLYL